MIHIYTEQQWPKQFNVQIRQWKYNHKH